MTCIIMLAQCDSSRLGSLLLQHEVEKERGALLKVWQ